MYLCREESITLLKDKIANIKKKAALPSLIPSILIDLRAIWDGRAVFRLGRGSSKKKVVRVLEKKGGTACGRLGQKKRSVGSRTLSRSHWDECVVHCG